MKAEDALWAGLTDSYAKLPMGLTAEKLGEKYGITRAEADQFGLRFVANSPSDLSLILTILSFVQESAAVAEGSRGKSL